MNDCYVTHLLAPLRALELFVATNKRIQPRFKLVAEQVPEGDPRDLTLTVTRRSRTVRLCVCVCDSLVLIKRPETALLIRRRTVSMSLAGLRYQSTTFGTAPQETKSGSYIYSGSPSGFHEWEFRTRIRVEFLKQKIKKKVLEHRFKATSASPERGRAERSPVVRRGDDGGAQETDAPGARGHSDPGSPEDGQTGRDGQGDGEQEEERPDYASPRAAPSFPGLVEDEQLSGEIDSLRAELVQKVLEGLRGDAYLAAQDLGVETLMKDGGIETLIATLKKMIFPLQSLEAKELFRVEQMQHGPLSRQTGESVTSFISRRRRWWRQVKELDSNMLISDQMRAELLIEGAGLTKQEQLMIRTASKSHTFDDYAAILLEHHGRIHLKDSRSLAPQYKSSPNYPQKKGQSKGSQKPWH